MAWPCKKCNVGLLYRCLRCAFIFCTGCTGSVTCPLCGSNAHPVDP
jgi:hypothetical protein